MVTLNSTYQYIGRTSGVSCDGGWNYYVLLYAKTSGDLSTGTHSVSVLMRLACPVDSTFYGYYTKGSVKIDGVSAVSWDGQQVPNNKWNATSITEDGVTYPRWIDLKECTAVVDAGFGAAKDVTIEASWQRKPIDGTTRPRWLPAPDTITANITATLPMLAGASTIIAAPNVTIGKQCKITWIPKAASLRYRLQFSVGNWEHTTGPIHPNTTVSYSYSGYTFPLEVANQFVTRTGELTVALYTYSDSEATNQIGSEHTVYIHITVPETEDTKPTISMSLAPVSTLSAPFDSIYLQGKSKIQATLDISTKYGADILESSITVDGIAYGYPHESGYLSKAGVLSVKGSVKDSREYYGTCDSEITVIPYSKPKVQAVYGERNIVATRCDENGNLSSAGTYLKIKARIGYEKVITNGLQNNFGKIQYRYKEVGAASYSTWQTILDTKTAAVEEITTEALLNGALSIKKSYHMQVRAIDDIDESEPVTISVPSDAVYMDRPAYGKGMGLGGYTQGVGNLDIYWKTKARGGLSLFNEDGEEISDDMLLLPRGIWNADSIADGVYEVSEYPLMDSSHPNELIMATGVLVQMSATVSGDVKLQLAFPADENSAAFRTRWSNHWTDWIYI